MANQVNQFIGIFNTFLLTFALIALFVGAFLIANTFSILIGQRTRELALLRAVGASRSQVTRSMLGEALVVGLAGSVDRVGHRHSDRPRPRGPARAPSASPLPPPASSCSPAPSSSHSLVGTGVTVVSASAPALRASRIPPVAALRDDAGLADASLRRRAIVGGALTLARSGCCSWTACSADSSGPSRSLGAGAALTFIGVATLAPFVAGGLARVIGAPLPALSASPASWVRPTRPATRAAPQPPPRRS